MQEYCYIDSLLVSLFASDNDIVYEYFPSFLINKCVNFFNNLLMN